MNKREVNRFLLKGKKAESRFLFENKKGFELVWSTIVIIILSLVLLTMIILFFTGTSGKLFNTIKSYFSETNVDSIIKGCNILVQGNQEYSFCCEKKIVKYYLQGEKVEDEFSCSELVNKDFINNRINELNCEGRVC